MAENKVKILVEAEDQASSKLKSIGSSFSSLAKIAVGAIGAISITQGIRASIQAMNDQVRVNTQLESVLRSTHNAVGLSSEAIQKMASDLQGLTTISDDTIQAGQNMLLTFTNIGKDVFPKATETLLDMATAMNGGATPSAEALSAQAIQLGKALNDPINGITSLTRVGVTFTEGQKATIESLVKTGETAKAQQIILAELNREFGGSSQAQAQTFAGKMEQLKNSLGDIAEIIGYALLPALTSIANKLKIVALQAVAFFNDNSQAIMQFASNLASFFQAVMGTILGTIQSVFNAITEAFSSIFGNAQDTGIGIGEVFSFLMKSIAMSFQIVATVASIAIRGILFGFRYMADKTRQLFIGVTTFLGNIVTGWGLIMEGLVNIVIGGVNLVMEALGKSTYEYASFGRDAFDSFTKEIAAQNEDVTASMEDNWSDLSKGVSGDIGKAVSNMDSMFSGFNKTVKGTSISLTGLALDGQMGMGNLASATGKTKDKMKELSDVAQKVISEITGKVNESKKAVDDLKDAIKKKTEEWTKYRSEGVKALSDVNNEIKKLRAEASDIQVKFRVSQDEKLSERYLQIQKEITQEGADVLSLTKEKELIERGVNKTILDNATAYEKMSETEKIILQIQKDKNKELEENKKKIEALVEKQSLLQLQADQKSIRDLKINADLKDGMITASYTNELGKKQEIHDYENVQLAVQIAEKQKAFSDEMATLEANLQTKLSREKSVLEELRVAYMNHNAFLKDDTKKTADAMISSLSAVARQLQNVINLRAQAGAGGGGGPVSGARAVGGAVAAGKTYIVGENGPETFVPSAAGRIEPNGGNGSPTIVINFGGVQITSDIDLEGFSDKLKKEITRSIELSNLGIT